MTKLYSKDFWEQSQTIHAQREWRAIHKAPGFPPNFSKWWHAVPHKQDGAPDYLTHELPTRAQIVAILATVEREVRSFERTLQASFREKAQNNRACNPHKVFRDFSKPLAQPVQILDHSKVATVIQVDRDEGSMILDRPTAFGLGPIAGPNGFFQPHICCEDTVWTDPADLVEPGSIIRQELLIGRFDELFDTFAKEWKARWDRHRDLPTSHWDSLLTFFQQAVPSQPTFQLPEISYELWIHAIKHKKPRAATGPDGLSRKDLLAMPRSSNQYRPITLFALPYRIWASIRTRQVLEAILEYVPPQCFGSIPGKAASHMWIQLQHLIEDAYDTGQPLSGGVADIQKCFNHIPRIPILGILIHLGMPPGVIRAWSLGLTQMTRHFSIRQSKGPGITSCTGFAEGCPLSIIAMLGVNVFVDLWVRLREPTDAATARGFAALETILTILDLPIDPSKSYVWATTTAGRKALQSSNVPIVKSCRDLGGQMQYTRQSTNFVITQRIEAFKPRWKDLTISPAPYRQKLFAIRAVAWTNTLHGIASAHLGTQHYDKLRTCAVKALQEHGPGVSPSVHLSFIEHPSFDPEFHAITATLNLCRSSLTRDQLEPVLTQLSLDPPRKRPKPGPSSVLLERLRQLGWRWDTNGIFLDHQDLPVDLWESPIQHVKTAMADAWQLQVCRNTSTRKTFLGMDQAHARFTCEQLPPAPRDLALLRTCLNGTFFTADHLKHRDPDADTNCHLCGQPNSVFHRQWECQSLDDARNSLTHEQKEQVTQMSPCTFNHGWFPLPSEVSTFQRMLYSIDGYPVLEQLPIRHDTIIHYFTDGGCKDPSDPFVRLCSWGLSAYPSTDLWTPYPVGSGLLPGPIETIVRAEWKAVIEALTSAWFHQRPFSIWCDNQSVVNRLRQMQQRPGIQWSGKIKNHDFLNAASNLMQQCQHLLKHVSKVSSHQDRQLATTEVDDWCFQGNDHADALASRVFTTTHPVVVQQTAAFAAISKARTLRDLAHSMFVRVGLAAVTRTSQQTDPETHTYNPRPQAAIVMIPWILDTGVECPVAFRIEPFAQLLEWNRSLHCPDEQVRMWSWWELYIDACFQIPQLAPTYSIRKLSWYNDPVPVVPFLKRAKSFSRYIHKLSHHLGVHVPARIATPSSAHLAFWCKCLPIQVSELRNQSVDAWLGKYLTGASRTADLSCIP